MSLAPHVLVAAGLEGTADGDVVAVPAATLHHLGRVLRLADGAPLTLTDGAGRVADAVLSGGVARRVGPVRSAPPAVPRLTLAQALAKGRRGEDAVRAACELGVNCVLPVIAARTQGRPDARAAEALIARWDAVAVAALEQSRGAWRAVVETPVVVDVLATTAPGALRIVAVPGATPLPVVVSDAPRARHDEVVVAVGPEGGWTAAEVDRLVAAGWRTAGLGPTVLRTEHAGPVAIAVLAALLGRWAEQPGPVGAAPSTGTLAGPPVEEHRHPVSGPQ